jgi:spermidine/putrescine transport system ATP-binding protein
VNGIRLVNIDKKLSGAQVLQEFNLNIPGGSFFALLGPSGCGKTTLLRLMAGFEQVDAGKIFLGTEDITNTPINQRRINTVFQNYALFPHLNVFDNIAYGLRLKNFSLKEIKIKVEQVLTAVHMEQFADRDVTLLSGGQQQRVALARAIVNEPAVLLLDEPLAALDLQLREKMLVELIELQSQLKTTFVYVTHDQTEALAVADYMVIMGPQGVIEQVGTPKDIYEYPATSFVANFVGSSNIFKGTLLASEIEEHWELMVDQLDNFSIATHQSEFWMKDGAELLMSVRPEKLVISKVKLTDPKHNFDNSVMGIVIAIIYHGRSTEYNVRLKTGQLIQIFEQNDQHLAVGDLIDYDDQVYVYWHSNAATLMPR